MFGKLKVKYFKSNQNVNVIWMTWGSRYRWISYECGMPIWWLPKFQKTEVGIRIGWLVFAVGTGVVNEEQMNNLNKHAI